MEALAIPFLLFVGSLLALQAGANVQLSGAVGSPIGASTLQLAIGAGLLLALTAVVGTLGAFGALADAEPAHLWGGIGSAVYITAGILLFPRLGALVAVGLFIAGQMGASLVLDGSGWLGVEREPLGSAAVAGALAIVVATWMIVRAQGGADSLDGALRNRGGWVAAGLAAGAVLPVQGAVNAQLSADVDAPITVGAFSFLVATATMAVALAALLALGRSPRPAGARLRRRPLVGLARRGMRRRLRDVGLRPDSRDRRGADGRAHRGRAADRLGLRGPPGPAAPAETADLAEPADRGRAAARGRGPDPARLERREQVHRVAVGIVHERVALAPGRVERLLVAVVAERDQPLDRSASTSAGESTRKARPICGPPLAGCQSWLKDRIVSCVSQARRSPPRSVASTCGCPSPSSGTSSPSSR